MVNLPAAILFSLIATVSAVPYEDLARQFAPEFRLTPAETFFPSSVEYLLPHVKIYTDSGSVLSPQPAPLTVDNLADAAPNSGASTWLTVDDTTAGWLVGSDPTKNNVPVYTFIAAKANGVVDLFYWTFYPYNKGKSIILLGEVGDHIGDWERLSVRTINGVPMSADYNAHSGGSQAAGTIAWASVPKVSGTDRPIAYVAEGSHGTWPAAGSNVYEDILVYQLTDETRDGGPVWDASQNVLPITYVPGGPYPAPLTWINFKGNWGNKGQTDCWWHSIVSECPLSDGPGGPARDDVLNATALAKTAGSATSLRTKFTPMHGAPSHTLATPSNTNHSTYTFYLTAPDHPTASQTFSHVSIIQNCVVSAQNATLSTSTTSTVAINTSGAYSDVSVAGCAPSSSVTSYQIGICVDSTSSSCAWTAPRALRVYKDSEKLPVKTAAIKLNDPDVWSFAV